MGKMGKMGKWGKCYPSVSVALADAVGGFDQRGCVGVSGLIDGVIVGVIFLVHAGWGRSRPRPLARRCRRRPLLGRLSRCRTIRVASHHLHKSINQFINSYQIASYIYILLLLVIILYFILYLIIFYLFFSFLMSWCSEYLRLIWWWLSDILINRLMERDWSGLRQDDWFWLIWLKLIGFKSVAEPDHLESDVEPDRVELKWFNGSGADGGAIRRPASETTPCFFFCCQ